MHKPAKKNVKAKSTAEAFNERILAYLGEETKLLKKHGLRKKPVITFPDAEARKTPWLGRFGMALVRAAGGILDTMYLEGKQK